MGSKRERGGRRGGKSGEKIGERGREKKGWWGWES